MKAFFIGCFVFFLGYTYNSCTILAINKYKIGRSFDFKSKSDFIDYLQNNQPFEEHQYLTIDSTSYFNVMSMLSSNNGNIIYIGCYLNDSLRLIDSKLLKLNSTCAGRIKNDILSNISLPFFPDSLIDKDYFLHNCQLNNLLNNSTFNINNNKKKIKIFLLYSYSAGTYYDKLYKDIFTIQKSNTTETELFIICTDPLFNFH